MRIASSFHKWMALATLLLTLSACGSSKSNDKADTETGISENEYSLQVVEDEDVYLRTVAEDLSKELVDLEQEIPGVRLDIRYATTDNFMRERLYPVAKAYLRAPAASALADAWQDRMVALRLRGMGALRAHGPSAERHPASYIKPRA